MPCERKHVEAIRKAVEGYVPTKPCPVCDDFRNLNKLISAALAACDESPWRSMESAPKDGTPISVLNEYNSPWYHVWWYVPTNPMARKGPHWRSYLGEVPFDPVKWAPLPAAPEVGK